MQVVDEDSGVLAKPDADEAGIARDGLREPCDPPSGDEMGVDDRTTEGVLVIRTTYAETLAALELAISTGQNQLIASDSNGNQLYALSSNELQIMGPEVHDPNKIYTFIFSPGICGIN